MRKVIFSIFAFMMIGGAIYGLVFWNALNGAPFLAVRSYLMNSKVAISGLGDVSEVRLLPFSSYHERTAGSTGNARFSIEIIGTTSRKKAIVEMEMQNDIWRAQQVRIDGQVLTPK